MYSVPGNLGRQVKTLRNLESLGLEAVARMHPDDLIALRAWVIAKRLYEQGPGISGCDGYRPV